MSAENARKLHEQQPQHTKQQEKVKVQVQKQKWISTGEKFMYSMVSAVAVAASIYVVSFASTTDGMNRDVQHLESKIDKQQVQIENLKFEKKELSKPERILQIAKDNGLEIRKSKVKSAGSVSGS
ncbi:cell division protein FtsL [Pontibacillus salicampi]|uniref:Cell division protein FtsL n=1 Tax=Pontibacillus salicampi TaxID=1449801 RepID=A0ABV6LP61_9BACI